MDFRDRVLLRNVGLQGKIADRWSQEVCVVVKQPNSDILVYDFKPETGIGRARVLYRNLLLPIPCLPVDQADGTIHFSNGDRDSEQSDVESDVHSHEGMVIPKPRNVVPVPTPRKTQGLSVTPQIDESNLAHMIGSVRAVHLDSGDIGSVRAVHLDSGDVVSSGTGEALSDELVGHGSGVEPDGEDSDVSEEVVANSSSSDSDTGGDSVAYNTPVPAPRRSTRVKLTTQLRPDFVYNFNQVAGDGQQTVTSDDEPSMTPKLRRRLTF